MGNLTLKELGRRAFETAKAKGFHDEPIDIPRALMLIVSELAEALEADRKNKRANVEAFGRWDATFRCIEEGNRQKCFISDFEAFIKDTFEDELADAAIRLFDLSTALGIDLETHVMLKMQYNEGRGYKHGKRY